MDASDITAAESLLLDPDAEDCERFASRYGRGLIEDRQELLKLAGEAWGALNFILAFYEPGQRYLDTNAWTQAEASGRRVRAALREKLDTLSAAAS